MIERACGVEYDGCRAEDAEAGDLCAAVHRNNFIEHEESADCGEQDTGTMGDCRPRAKPIIRRSALFHRPTASANIFFYFFYIIHLDFLHQICLHQLLGIDRRIKMMSSRCHGDVLFFCVRDVPIPCASQIPVPVDLNAFL